MLDPVIKYLIPAITFHFWYFFLFLFYILMFFITEYAFPLDSQSLYFFSYLKQFYFVVSFILWSFLRLSYTLIFLEWAYSCYFVSDEFCSWWIFTLAFSSFISLLLLFVNSFSVEGFLVGWLVFVMQDLWASMCKLLLWEVVLPSLPITDI